MDVAPPYGGAVMRIRLSNVRHLKLMRTALFLMLLVWSSGAYACDCARSSLNERVSWSSAVFVGEILEFIPLVSVQLKVVESFHGSSRGSLTISIRPSDCDYFLPPLSPQAGDQFLVFMNTTGKINTVSRCLDSAPASSASTEIQLLRDRSQK